MSAPVTSYTEPPETCPRCQGALSATSRHRWGEREVGYLELGQDGVPQRRRLTLCRWRCRACRGTHIPLPPELYAPHRLTRRLADYIYDQTLERTYAAVAGELGLDDTTVRRVSLARIAEVEAAAPREIPRRMGLGGVRVAGRPCVLVVDLDARAVVDLTRMLREYVAGRDATGVEGVRLSEAPVLLADLAMSLPHACVGPDLGRVVGELRERAQAMLDSWGRGHVYEVLRHRLLYRDPLR